MGKTTTKTARRSFRGRKRAPKKKTGINIRVADMAAGGKLIDGLFGLDNLFNLDFKSAGAEFKRSITNPLAPGGLLDDGIDAGEVYLIMNGLNSIAKKLTGRGIGGSIKGIRISLA